MKRTTLCGIVLLMSVLWAGVSFAFDSGSTGADGAFSPTENAVLQLPSDGIFNFTTVDIPSGVTVTFSKNATNTPVYILATGDVNIAGTISVSGTSACYSGCQFGTGGNGGFDGGSAGQSGLGPGGGGNNGSYGDGGGFGTVGGGTYGGAIYSNINIVPFMGGSGGGGGSATGGGGGGGAVLIASSGTVNITGSIMAYGGSGVDYYNSGGGGSGGAIKIVATTISGNGSISAAGGWGFIGTYGGQGYGGAGRIRLESNNFLRTAATTPNFSYGTPTSVFPSTMPALRISSIRGTAAPSSPGGSYSSPDMTLVGTVNPVQIAIEASNIPVGSTVTVSATPNSGSKVETTVMLSGTLENSSATAELTLDVDNPNITYVVQAYTTFTMQTAMYYEGEKVERAMVAAGAAGGGQVTYITSSGREIPAEMLMASLR